MATAKLTAAPADAAHNAAVAHSSADTAAPAPVSVDDLIKGAIGAFATLQASKPWRQSLTYQGVAIAAAGGWIALHGASFLAFMAPTVAADVARSAGEVVGAIGSFMAVIGRARIGGLH